MKRRRIISIAVLLFLALGVALFSGPAIADTTLSLQTTSDGTTAKTQFVNTGSDYVILNIIANPATNIAGCAFTLNYPADVLTAPTITTDGLPSTEGDIISSFPFTFTQGETTTQTSRENNVVSGNSGKLYFSGAAIDGTTGGARAPVSNALFTVKFQVKQNAQAGSYQFSLNQTVLNNTAAGYAAEGEPIPVLVNAVPNTDTTNWGNLGAAFPILAVTMTAGTLAIAPFDIVTGTPVNYTVAGTISYSGKQTGTLYVGAFNSISAGGCSGPVGQGFSGTWSGSGNYTLSNIPSGSNVYVCSYIDSVDPVTAAAANGVKDAWEAKGVYPNMTSPTALTVTGNLTGIDFTLIDPDVNGNNLPDWWERTFGLYSTTNPISASASYIHDGYSNLAKYQNSKNPTVADAPGGTGYDPALDTRSYTIAGMVSYTGAKTGTLYCGALNPNDNSIISGTGYAVGNWSGTSQAYTLSLNNGTYKAGCYISTRSNPTGPDTTEAQGLSAQVALSGANQTVNVALTDPDTPCAWQSTIHAIGRDYSGAVKAYDVIIGVDSQVATLDAPPAPPQYTVKLELDKADFSTTYSKDIRQVGSQVYRWIIAVNPKGNVGAPGEASATISWDPSSFITTCSGKPVYYKLRSGYDGTGSIVVSDMRTTTSYTVTGSNQDYYFTIEYTYNVDVNLNLSAGWNLVSLPVVPDDTSLTALFPDATVAYKFSGTYQSVTTLEPGVGYWVKVPSNRTYTVSGASYDSYAASLSTGWSLMGAVNGTKTPASDPTGVISVMYGFSGSYSVATSLSAGNGYWVKVTQPCTFTVGP